MMKRHDSENRAIPATDAIDKAPQSARMAEDAQQRPTGSPSERERLKQLEQKFDQALMDTVISKTRERVKVLKDYQSQAKYGLARLYDNTTRDAGQ